MGEPKDLNVGEAIKVADPLLAEAPADLDKLKGSLDQFIGSIADSAAKGSQAHVQALAVRAAIDGGVLQGENAIFGIQRLLKEFAFPLKLVGGTPLHGSGQLLGALDSGLQGLKYAMTKAQKVIAIAKPILQTLIYMALVFFTIQPGLGAVDVGGRVMTGITISKLVDLLAAWLNVKLSKYPDAPRAELVK
jgi:hypothetical protein